MKRNIIITGVSSGVGKETAIRFLQKKWNVIGLSRTNPYISAENFFFILTDLTNINSINKAYDIIQEKYEKVDVFVNNAAIFRMKPFTTFSVEEINDLIDTNFKGAVFCTLNTLKLMTKGRIINIDSVSGTHGIENQAIYSATKYALNGFYESLSQETIKDNILISTICPGGINTPLWNENNEYPGGNTNKLLNATDIVDLIEYISNLPDHVVLKTLTIFPTNEWH